MINRMRAFLGRRKRDETGTASIEFVLTVPLVIFIFLAALESGIYMTRYVMLDRALDITVRALRLGQIETPALETLRGRVCDEVAIIPDCKNQLKIELYRVDTGTWNFPDRNIDCVDRGAAIKPVVEPNLGAENEVMLVIACMTADALFPTTGIAAQMTLDSKGGYYVFAASGFVNEP